MTALAYISNPLDRCANLRGDAVWLARQLGSTERRMVHINGDKTVVDDGRLVTTLPSSGDENVFLGLDAENRPWFACRSTVAENLRDLRALALEALLPPDELGILAQARTLVHWHERRAYCSNCATPLVFADAGYRRHCPGCQMDHFPRTDPVVIIVVRHAGRILLGRQAAWPHGMYSALAGFMEPGETLEDAARREVFEEAGVRVGEVAYVASQPWPFPANLMIGLIGEALGDAITIDRRELEDARWFSFDEARQLLAGTHPHGFTSPRPMAIAHCLVTQVLQLS